MPDFATGLLTPEAWPAFAALVERRDGVWGGCRCVGFHLDGKLIGAHRRSLKAQKVPEGTAHAASVFDRERRMRWCRYGATAEWPRIKHMPVCMAGRILPSKESP